MSMSNDPTKTPSRPDNHSRPASERVTLSLTIWAIAVGLAIFVPIEILRLREAVDSKAGWASWFTPINLDTTLPLFVFLLLPLFWFIRQHKPREPRGFWRTWFGPETKPHEATTRAEIVRAVILAALVGLTSWSVSVRIGATGVAVNTPSARRVMPLCKLPPALHDEYSYLFQSQTFLAGRAAYASHPQYPQLFDQMHVLNDNGVHAGRYFPGTALWMAPFVALGKPYWGHWLAGALSAAFVFSIGRELAGNAPGLFAGLLAAVSPGIQLFAQLLLAHHPTMVGLTFFAWMFLRMMRTLSFANAFLAGLGLIFATLCRPMTAAGIGFPFGIWLVYWWIRGLRNSDQDLQKRWNFRRRSLLILNVGLPIGLGLLAMLVYDYRLTGSPWTTPYELYTKIYTPRHVYGFNNVERAASNPSKKVVENYDKWAENLTPTLAARNVQQRLVATGEWVLGVVPLAMVIAVFPFVAGRSRSGASLSDGRWWLVFLAVLSLHIAHIPYWYVGIRYWHYVFEAAPFVLLIYAGVSCYFMNAWRQSGRIGLVVWWISLAGCSLLVAYVSLPPLWDVSRFQAAIEEDIWARRNYAVFNDLLDRTIKQRPALVLIANNPADRHIDYVTNIPPLDRPILRGRFRSELAPLNKVLEAFPDRSVYAVVLDPSIEKKILMGRFSGVRFVRISEQRLVSGTAVVYRVDSSTAKAESKSK